MVRVFSKISLLIALAGLLVAPAAAGEALHPSTCDLIEQAVIRTVTNDFLRLHGEDLPACLETPELAMCLHPDTPKERIDELLRTLPVYQEGDDRYERQNRWGTTATDGWTGTIGNPITLTYSFVPDDTWIPGSNGEPASPSTLYATMNTHYGSPDVWKPMFNEHFELWGEHIGITYIEVEDDGAAFPDSPGALGSRGDVRICAHYIDGQSGVLAYNFFPPNGGDMTLDDSEYWSQPHYQYRFFRNVISHEHGHGHGLGHVLPEQCNKLMESALCMNFDGPRDDDIRGGMSNYGDFLENDDNAAEATDLGAFNGEMVIATPSLNNSLDHDWFKFTLNNSGTVSVVLDPVGDTYMLDSQVIHTDEIIDLKFELRGEPNGGVVLVAVNETSYGDNEVLNEYALDPGDYWLHVARHAGTSDVQRYDLTITINATSVDSGQPLAGMGLGIYPNPFNPKTTAHFYVSESGPVSLDIYDVTGGLVRSIQDRASAAGWMKVEWNGRNDAGATVPSGIYFMQAKAGSQSETVRAVLLK